MKSKDTLSTLRKSDVKTLYKKLNEEYKNLHNLRFATKFRNLKDISKTKKNKREIARIYTVLAEKLN